MNGLLKFSHTLTLGLVLALLPLQGMSEPNQIGIVIMHGKGGSPSKHVASLANALEGKGYLVANLEMPWSGKREYDVGVVAAEAQVESALTELRRQGAKKVFVAGHSQGGVFALHFAGKHVVDGIVCMAPGGSVGSKVFRDKLGESVARANQLVEAGQGGEKHSFHDYEGKKGKYPVETTPAIYLSWFSPGGAMDTKRSASAANPQIPILWIVAKHDYPGLIATNIPLFHSLPRNPLTQLYEPDTDHLGAPSASLDEIVRWTATVAGPGGG